MNELPNQPYYDTDINEETFNFENAPAVPQLNENIDVVETIKEPHSVETDPSDTNYDENVDRINEETEISSTLDENTMSLFMKVKNPAKTEDGPSFVPSEIPKHTQKNAPIPSYDVEKGIHFRLKKEDKKKGKPVDVPDNYWKNKQVANGYYRGTNIPVKNRRNHNPESDEPSNNYPTEYPSMNQQQHQPIQETLPPNENLESQQQLNYEQYQQEEQQCHEDPNYHPSVENEEETIHRQDTHGEEPVENESFQDPYQEHESTFLNQVEQKTKLLNENSERKAQYSAQEGGYTSHIHQSPKREEPTDENQEDIHLLQEKTEALRHLKELKAEGNQLSKEFTVNDKLDEMLAEIRFIHRVNEQTNNYEAIKGAASMFGNLVSVGNMMFKNVLPLNSEDEEFSQKWDKMLEKNKTSLMAISKKYCRSGSYENPERTLLIAAGTLVLGTIVQNTFLKTKKEKNNPQPQNSQPNHPPPMYPPYPYPNTQQPFYSPYPQPYPMFPMNHPPVQPQAYYPAYPPPFPYYHQQQQPQPPSYDVNPPPASSTNLHPPSAEQPYISPYSMHYAIPPFGGYPMMPNVYPQFVPPASQVNQTNQTTQTTTQTSAVPPNIAPPHPYPHSNVLPPNGYPHAYVYPYPPPISQMAPNKDTYRHAQDFHNAQDLTSHLNHSAINQRNVSVSDDEEGEEQVSIQD